MFKEFYEKFGPEEKEFLVLRHEGGGGSFESEANPSFWVGQAYFLAYIDVATGELHQDEGRLSWPVTNEEQKKGGCFGKFKDNTIYRVRVRLLIDHTVPEGILPSAINNFFVTEIIEENAHSPVLEDILKEYQKPVIIEDNLLGRLELNKEFELFSSWIQWNGKKVGIDLDVDIDNKASWTKARNAAKKLVENQKEYDEKMRNFAAEKLTELANSWQTQMKLERPEITEYEFATRIHLTSISIDSGGTYTFWYNDDDMFLGHAVTVRGSLHKGPKHADIEG